MPVDVKELSASAASRPQLPSITVAGRRLYSKLFSNKAAQQEQPQKIKPPVYIDGDLPVGVSSLIGIKEETSKPAGQPALDESMEFMLTEQDFEK